MKSTPRVTLSPLKKKQIKLENNQFGPFLNVKSVEKEEEILNPKLKKILGEIENYGPYYNHCPSCKNKNLTFYKHMREKDAFRILEFIKKEKQENQRQHCKKHNII